MMLVGRSYCSQEVAAIAHLFDGRSRELRNGAMARIAVETAFHWVADDVNDGSARLGHWDGASSQKQDRKVSHVKRVTSP